MTVRLFTVDMDSPADMAGLEAAIAVCGKNRLRRVAILTKVEGNPVPNDFSRELARQSLSALLAKYGIEDRSLVLLSVGCEGVATPLSFLIADMAEEEPPAAGRRLALGIARSAPVAAYEHGSAGLVTRVADTVRAALADGALAPENAALVLVKVPTAAPAQIDLTPEQTSMSRGRAVGALGVGCALGEIAPARITEAAIGRDLTLMTRHAMTFAGPELDRIEVVALGNRPGAGGDLTIATAFMADILDGTAIRRMLSEAGARPTPWGELADPAQVPALLVKAGIPPDDRLRGARIVAHRGALPADGQMRAALSGVVGSILGHTRFFVSGDPVQQAPPGGGIAAAILRVTNAPA